MIREIRSALEALGSPAKAAGSMRFFKAGKGEYGEGDLFHGVTVPEQRAIAKRFREAPFDDLEAMLADPVHEMRLTALLILVLQFKNAGTERRKAIVDFYLRHLDGVNNWDLVDGSAPHILGAWLLGKKDRSVLYRLARSGKLWRERVAIVATQELIRHGEFEDTIRIATILLAHEHDLIHKAVGWMLRETGKKDMKVLREFLGKHAATMPRTALRYAIERMSPAERELLMGTKERGV
jgi:3-methyladenine DNA glycosylase AlkD